MNSPQTGKIADAVRRSINMMERLDVDVLEMAYADLGRTYGGACKVCLKCEKVAECFQWFDATIPGAERPTFCPNLPLFEHFIVRCPAGKLGE